MEGKSCNSSKCQKRDTSMVFCKLQNSMRQTMLQEDVVALSRIKEEDEREEKQRCKKKTLSCMLVMRGKSTVPGSDTSTAFTVKNRCCLSCLVVVSPDDNNPYLFHCHDGKEVRCCKAQTEGHRGWMVRMDLSTETHDCAKAPDILALSLSLSLRNKEMHCFWFLYVRRSKIFNKTFNFLLV